MKKVFNKYKNANLDDKLAIVMLAGLSIFMLGTYLLSSTRLWIGIDTGYYLGVTELIHKGLVPFRDFRLDYTPLFFYILQIPRLFMGEYPNYTGYILFLYLIAVIDAIILAVIVKRISTSRKIAYLSGLLFLISYYYLEGGYFVLETFSLCCGLVAILVLIKKDCSFIRCFISGICCALAFLSKQYGLLFAGCIGAYLLFSKENWKGRLCRCIYAFSGFLLVIVIFILSFKFSGCEPRVLLKALSGSSYGNQSIDLYVDGVIKSIKLFPFLLFTPYIFFKKDANDNRIIITCLTGLVLATFQFYFNVFAHYYIYMIPLAIIIGVVIWQQLKRVKKSHLIILLFYGILFTSFALPMQSVYKSTKSLVKHNQREFQDQTTHQLRQIIKDYKIESGLCYWHTIPYYATCALSPSAIKEYGFSFGSDNEETFTERLKDADCFIINQNAIDEVPEMKMMSKYLSENFIRLNDTYADGTIIYLRNELLNSF